MARSWFDKILDYVPPALDLVTGYYKGKNLAREQAEESAERKLRQEEHSLRMQQVAQSVKESSQRMAEKERSESANKAAFELFRTLPGNEGAVYSPDVKYAEEVFQLRYPSAYGGRTRQQYLEDYTTQQRIQRDYSPRTLGGGADATGFTPTQQRAATERQTQQRAELAANELLLHFNRDPVKALNALNAAVQANKGMETDMQRRMRQILTAKAASSGGGRGGGGFNIPLPEPKGGDRGAATPSQPGGATGPTSTATPSTLSPAALARMRELRNSGLTLEQVRAQLIRERLISQ